MGQAGTEFCQGCRDCTNINAEGNLSNQANLPISNSQNPFFHNAANISVNDVNVINGESFLYNDPHKNQNDSITDLTVNSQLNPYANPDTKLYGLNSGVSKDGFSTSVTNNNNPYSNFNNYSNNYNNVINYNNIIEKTRENNKYSSIDLDKLEQIIKKYYVKIIIKSFKKLKMLKIEAHKQFYSEYSTIPSYEFLSNISEEDLDVNLAPNNNCIYLGQKFNSKKDGQGLEFFSENNAKYFGYFRNGKRVDMGVFTINNNDKIYQYFGEIKGIYANNFGIYINGLNSNKYEGDWKNSYKEGYGIEYYKDNSYYKGEFFKGKKNGIGYYLWNDGSYYEGEWNENKLDGYGIYKFKDGSYYKGEWKHNRMSELGEFTYPGEKTYFGYFVKDMKEGFGILIWYKEKKAFIGFWKNNRQSGIGKFIMNDKIKLGIWDNGKMVEKIKHRKDFYSKLKSDQKIFLPYFKIEDYRIIEKCIKKILREK